MPSSSRDGPLTISIGNTLDVVVVSPNAFHSGSEIASSAATTTPKAAGSTPASAALIATSSTVATPLRGGRTHTTWSGGYGDAANSASIASSVAGNWGTPSPQRSSNDNSYCARGSAGTSTRSLASVTRSRPGARGPSGSNPRRSSAAP